MLIRLISIQQFGMLIDTKGTGYMHTPIEGSFSLHLPINLLVRMDFPPEYPFCKSQRYLLQQDEVRNRNDREDIAISLCNLDIIFIGSKR